MNESTLHEQLYDLVTRDEPQLTITSRSIAQHGNRVRRRRRATVAGLVCALVPIAGVSIVSIVGSPGSEPLTREERVDEALAGYSAEEFPDVIDAAVRSHVDEQPPLVTASVDALDSFHEVLQGSERDDTAEWWATFIWDAEFGAGSTVIEFADVLEVHLGHNRAETEGDAEEYCENSLAFSAISCEVASNSDGTVTISDTFAVERMRRGSEVGARSGEWRVVPLVGYDNVGENLWFVHRVKAHRLGIFFTSARELVKASSFAEAEEMWRLSTNDLHDIATDPDLSFPAPD